MRSIVTVPGGPANVAISLPPRLRPYRLFTLAYRLVNDATVAARYPVLTISIGGLTLVVLSHPSVQTAASTNFRMVFGAGLTSSASTAANVAAIMLPTDGLFVPEGASVALSFVNGQPGDVVSDVVATIEDEP